MSIFRQLSESRNIAEDTEDADFKTAADEILGEGEPLKNAHGFLAQETNSIMLQKSNGRES